MSCDKRNGLHAGFRDARPARPSAFCPASPLAPRRAKLPPTRVQGRSTRSAAVCECPAVGQKRPRAAGQGSACGRSPRGSGAADRHGASAAERPGAAAAMAPGLRLPGIAPADATPPLGTPSRSTVAVTKKPQLFPRCDNDRRSVYRGAAAALSVRPRSRRRAPTHLPNALQWPAAMRASRPPSILAPAGPDGVPMTGPPALRPPMASGPRDFATRQLTGRSHGPRHPIPGPRRGTQPEKSGTSRCALPAHCKARCRPRPVATFPGLSSASVRRLPPTFKGRA